MSEQHSQWWLEGYNDGHTVGWTISLLKLREFHPDWSEDQCQRYLNGRDEGVAAYKQGGKP